MGNNFILQLLPSDFGIPSDQPIANRPEQILQVGEFTSSLWLQTWVDGARVGGARLAVQAVVTLQLLL
jgi:hypothetical protein